MLLASSGGVSMRRLCILVLASSLLAVLPLAIGGDRAAAIFSCGMFDGKFECRATQGGVAHGKNAAPGERESPEEAPQGSTDGTWQSQTTSPAGPNGTDNGGQGSQSGGPAQ